MDLIYYTPLLLVKYCGRIIDIKVKKIVIFYKFYCLIYITGMILFQGYELSRAILKM